MSTIRVATPEDHIDLVMSRCGWQPGDVIQPMLVTVKDKNVHCTRTTVRAMDSMVAQCHERRCRRREIRDRARARRRRRGW